MLTGARLHPERATIERLTTEDAERLGLLDARNRRRFAAFNTLVPYVYPTASVERARVCALWCNWLFFFDDAHDEREAGGPELKLEHATEAATHALALLSEGVQPADCTPLDALLLEFRERSLQLMGAAWLSRFTAHAADYLLRGTLPACRHWLANTTPALDAYLVQREYDSAVYTACALIELAQGLRLSEEVLTDPDFERLNRACTRTVAFFNDLASYPKEVLAQHNPNNLVHVLAVERGLPTEVVLPEAVQLVNATAHDVEKAERRLSLKFPGDEHVAGYLVGVRHWQRGNIESSLLEPRYRASASPFADLRPQQQLS
ncbi:MAG: terpene synthase family protein [Archangium sp.]